MCKECEPGETVVSEQTYGQQPSVGIKCKTYAREDHTHGTPPAPVIPPIPQPSNTVVTEQSYNQSSSTGTSTTYSRGDHTHGTPISGAVSPSARNLTNQTGIKSNQNIYQNTDTKGMLVMVTIGFPNSGTRAMGVSVDSVNPPVSQQTGVLFNNYLGTPDMQTQVTFYVPPGYFYRLDNSGTGAHVIYWWELLF